MMQPHLAEMALQLREGTAIERVASATALGNTADDRAVPPLIAALRDVDADVRRHAAWALATLGTRAVPDLIALLTDTATAREGQQLAALALGKIGDVRALDPLVAVLLSADTNADVRRYVITAFGDIGDPRAIEPLIHALTANLPGIYDIPCVLLKMHADRAIVPIIRFLAVIPMDEDSDSGCPEVADCLSRFGETARPALLNAIHDPDSHIRFWVCYTLGRMATDDVPTRVALLQSLYDADPLVSESAAHALHRWRDPATCEPLIRALTLPNLETRLSIVSTLGLLRDEQALLPLKALLADPVREMRQSAKHALITIGTERAIAILVDAPLEDEHPADDCNKMLHDVTTRDAILLHLQSRAATEREDAVWNLIDSPDMVDERIFQACIAALRDAQAEIRQHAAIALGLANQQDAVEPLIQTLTDSVELVRICAAISLGRLRDPRGVAPLVKIFRDETESVNMRDEAVTYVGHLGDSAAVAPLLALLRNQDTAQQIRVRCVYALGDIGDPRASEPLIKALTDADERLSESAAWSLSHFPTPAVGAALMQALAHHNRQISTAAAWSLGEIGEVRALPLLDALLHSEIPATLAGIGTRSTYAEALIRLRRLAQR